MNRLSTYVFILAASLSAAGCLKVPQQTGFLASARNVERPASEVRLIGFEYGRRFSAVVEQAADSITRLTTDPAVEYNAIAWKAYAIPAAHEAVLQFDPLVGVVDVWVFSHQMRDYFALGPGREWFGAHQQVAIDASVMLEREAHDMAMDLTEGRMADSTVALIDSMARAEPIRNRSFSRASVSLVWSDLAGAGASGLAGTAANMERQLDEVTNRLAYYNEYLFKLARWEGELMMGDIANLQQVDTTLSSLQRALSIFTDLADSLPELVLAERLALIHAIENERVSIVDAIDQQRMATVEVAEAQVDILLRSLGSERALILAAIKAERMATMASLDSILAERIGQTESVVDHLIWRLAQLILVVGLALLVVVIVFYRLARRGRQAQARA
ncbi:MAG: hypothetical protein JSW51_12195 [Gemmatimonadota bacterium]|nr:MAG: hypothetical protein JSW51_12195 [Gemmatimonadota bacterium]